MVLRRQDGFGYPLFARKTNSGFCSCPMATAAWLLAGQACDPGMSLCGSFREGSGAVTG